jgi:hypothetical protein
LKDRKEREFFFEKKNQKTFFNLGLGCVRVSRRIFGALAQAKPVMAGTAIHGFSIFARERAQSAKEVSRGWPFRP